MFTSVSFTKRTLILSRSSILETRFTGIGEDLLVLEVRCRKLESAFHYGRIVLAENALQVRSISLLQSSLHPFHPCPSSTFVLGTSSSEGLIVVILMEVSYTQKQVIEEMAPSHKKGFNTTLFRFSTSL